jgi:hypothetical protein
MHLKCERLRRIIRKVSKEALLPDSAPCRTFVHVCVTSAREYMYMFLGSVTMCSHPRRQQQGGGELWVLHALEYKQTYNKHSSPFTIIELHPAITVGRV